MKITKTHVALTLIALSGAACSSEPETEYPQPAASVGEEATPAERTAEPNATQGQEATQKGTPADQPISSMTAAPATPAAAVATTTQSAAMPDTAPAAVQLTDAEIAKVTDVVNTGEIEQAKLAKTKATSQRVKNFATTMLNQHTQMQQKDAQLARKLTLTLEDNSVAEELASKGAKTLADLKLVEATRFDQAYMAAQVAQHREVLELIDQQLIPQARETQLKAALEKARAMVQKHLTDAEQIQQQL
jgi:putative membrane protein